MVFYETKIHFSRRIVRCFTQKHNYVLNRKERGLVFADHHPNVCPITGKDGFGHEQVRYAPQGAKSYIGGNDTRLF